MTGDQPCSVRLSSKEAAGVVHDAVDTRYRGKRNIVEGLNFDGTVTVHEPETGENIIDVVDPVWWNCNGVILNLNIAIGVVNDQPNRRGTAANIDDCQRRPELVDVGRRWNQQPCGTRHDVCRKAWIVSDIVDQRTVTQERLAGTDPKESQGVRHTTGTR